jgi:hypothetical protein
MIREIIRPESVPRSRFPSASANRTANPGPVEPRDQKLQVQRLTDEPVPPPAVHDIGSLFQVRELVGDSVPIAELVFADTGVDEASYAINHIC